MLSINDIEFLVDQEPDDMSEITAVHVVFKLSGKPLAQLLGKQRRVLRRVLEKMKRGGSPRALSLLADGPVPLEVRRAVRNFVIEHFVYDLGIDAPRISGIDWSESTVAPYDGYTRATALPEEEAVRFEVDIDVLLD